MNEGGDIARWLHALLNEFGLGSGIGPILDGDALPLAKLPVTASWVSYYIALSYLAAHETGRHARPDSGDQVDFRHSAYAGVADIFVTGDTRMFHVLSEMVDHKRARIVTPEDLDKILRS